MTVANNAKPYAAREAIKQQAWNVLHDENATPVAQSVAITEMADAHRERDLAFGRIGASDISKTDYLAAWNLEWLYPRAPEAVALLRKKHGCIRKLSSKLRGLPHGFGWNRALN